MAFSRLYLSFVCKKTLRSGAHTPIRRYKQDQKLSFSKKCFLLTAKILKKENQTILFQYKFHLWVKKVLTKSPKCLHKTAQKNVWAPP